MALTNLLSIAQGALLTHERAAAIVGHNIANADTPGYSRQRANLNAATPAVVPPLGHLGRGVQLVSVERLRSQFFDESYRREAGVHSQFDTIRQTLEQVTGILAEPGDAGLSAALDGVIDAFHSLASNPVDPAARSVVLSSASALADRFRSIDARLESTAQNTAAQLRDTVRSINGLVAEIGTLNGQIRQAGGRAPDLLDRRDQALDQLSRLADVRVLERGQGAVDVLVGGLQLVSESGATQSLSVSGTGPYQLQLGSPGVPVSVSGGAVRGLFDSLAAIGDRGTATTRATGLRGQLDDFALSLVSAVNQIHSGYDPLANPLQPTLTPAPTPLRTIGPLFDPAGVTAGSIAIDAAILADPSLLAAGYSTAPGDNTIALRLGELRNLAVPIPGATGATANSPAVAAGPAAILGEYYTGVVSSLGVVTRDATNRAAAQTTLVDSINTQRQDVSGVSIDEEMVKLIEHQQAYSAAARLVQVADEMLRELINLGR